MWVDREREEGRGEGWREGRNEGEGDLFTSSSPGGLVETEEEP